LETSASAARITAALLKYGWQPVASGKPDYQVGFDYETFGSQSYRGVRKIIGMTSSGSTTRHSGTVDSYGSSASYSGTSYTPATYGVVGVVPYTYRLYAQGLVVMINGPEGIVFQGEALSEVPESTIHAVLPAMIDSVFTRFPGQNGSTTTIRKPLR
jgi:hypothetical protein